MKLSEVVTHFLMDCQIRGRSDYTLTAYKQRLGVLVQVLEQVCGITEIEQVKVVHLRQCIQHLSGTHFVVRQGRRPASGSLSSVTVQAYVRVCKAFFHWCYEEDLLDHNPSNRLSPPKAPVRIVPTFTPEHIEMMLAVCDVNSDLGFRDYVMLLLLFDTGMRISEICSLRVTDIHDTYVKVFGKGRKEREIGIHPEVSKLLWKYIHKHRHPANPDETGLFLNRGNKPLRPLGLHEMLKRIQKDAGLQDIKFSAHVFRHTFAKMYLEHGGEVFKLSREMGHSHVQVTEIYLKDFGSTEARKEHTAFSPITSIELKKKKRGKKKQQ